MKSRSVITSIWRLPFIILYRQVQEISSGTTYRYFMVRQQPLVNFDVSNCFIYCEFTTVKPCCLKGIFEIHISYSAHIYREAHTTSCKYVWCYLLLVKVNLQISTETCTVSIPVKVNVYCFITWQPRHRRNLIDQRSARMEIFTTVAGEL